MNTTHSTFTKKSETKAFDQEHRQKLNFNIGKYDDAVKKGREQYSNYESARRRASYIKSQVIENLDKYLIEFEKNFTANGGKVIWARDAKEALREISVILKARNARSVVKAKSMTTEEIHLNEHLEKEGIEAVETDLGEYIVQLAGQKPYHIVTPAMHMSKKDVSDLFHEKLNTPETDDARELTLTARRLLREKYFRAEVGITGANFLAADIGGVAVTENEGNARLCTAVPKTHIAIVGIEKIIPSVHDLALFWPLLATAGTGQQVTVYNSVFTGPRKSDETDGPEEMFVVLLDNGRTALLAEPDKRQALYCIRCGACLNTCPVYKNIGGHTYDTTYGGPIGSVISPHFEGMEKFKHLSYASSLCGACTEVCPVGIDIHRLLLLNRKKAVAEGHSSRTERIGFRYWRRMMLKGKRIDAFGSGIKNFFLRLFLKNSWGKRRTLFRIAPKSFRKIRKVSRTDKS